MIGYINTKEIHPEDGFTRIAENGQWEDQFIRNLSLLGFTLKTGIGGSSIMEFYPNAGNGPIMKAAEMALETGNANYVLILSLIHI